MLRTIVQVAFAESVPPLTLMLEVPSGAVVVASVKVPVVHDVVNPFGVLITSPSGKISEKPTPFREVEFGLCMVKVKVLALPRAILSGEKLLARVGTEGRGQPEIETLSRNTVSSVLLPAPTK